MHVPSDGGYRNFRMVRIGIINPNSTVSMTGSIAVAARLTAQAGTEIIAMQNDSGPASIEGPIDGAKAVPGLLDRIERAERSDAVEVYIIACFDDTGLDAARMLTRKPVIGIGEAAARVASIVARRFTVITTLPVSVPILEDNLVRYGLSPFATVRASGIPVLALEANGEAALSIISEEIQEALRVDRADAIVLGCAGMSDMARRLASLHGVPVVEGVSAAVRLAELLVGLELHPRQDAFATSRRSMTASLAAATRSASTHSVSGG
ncbi:MULTISPECIES: aspartate/glutamate racemase family protein [unclassified Mesorhizobium]|uniref:aspartate/glutamate racemase family protein n=2 Tax=unclassified Mesorhizobium TaxID=325217 RepID=UPI001CCFEAF0|nr:MULTISPECIES: aspartate/glutamate racemase family protein [unclassified Mesorhizobium]MCA0000246.1 aspartate/glutamate racemase family protein [Mesorhizobium sp. B264B2A]MCA0006298.1 aspartate/glutamate racemase family protein [Mesorhizobium sp. B264B1B]MCA0017888.1 aspartate/glutamate racemase family protein [Mesorhizobium sp. B264B1A]